MKRLFPLLLAAASFTIVGCNNQKKTAPASPNTSAEMSQQPAPQPYQPPADNTMTQPQPAPAPETMPPSSSTEQPQATRSTHHHVYARHGKYIVKKGDTLSKIAHEHRVSLKRLEAANPKVDPNKIRVGQTINIP